MTMIKMIELIKTDDDDEDAPCQKLITYKWVHCWMMELDHQDVILILLTEHSR